MNFSLILFFVVLFTGAMWALNRWIWAPRRDPERSDPWWVDYTAGLFPVFFVIFLLRSFVAEPFRIPSGSMLPTLLIGDLILVNKYEYGIRLPVIHKKIVDMGQPQRGDVVVFRYPPILALITSSDSLAFLGIKYFGERAASASMAKQST